jgi:hypothetical protein
VVLRVRPLSAEEERRGDQRIVQAGREGKSARLLLGGHEDYAGNSTEMQKEYHFDKVRPSGAAGGGGRGRGDGRREERVAAHRY